MIIVLSGSFAETAKFAKQQGLRNVRHIVDHTALRGPHPKRVHLLPSYLRRRDVHAINSELRRYARHPSPPEVVSYVGSMREGWRPDGVEPDQIAESVVPAPVREPETDIALATDVIADVQASQLAALRDVDAPVDEAEDFFAMLDRAGS